MMKPTVLQISPSFFEIATTNLNQHFSQDFNHFNAYGYHNWQMIDSLALDLGLSYDYISEPVDPATTPFVDQKKTKGLISPKIGFVFTPFDNTIVRAAYTRSLSSLDGGQSVRIEPTEVAGFNQAFRSIIPESVAGDTSGSRFDAYDISLEQKFDTGTYLGLAGELLYSRLDDVAGSFIFNTDQTGTNNFPISPSGQAQSWNYREKSLVFTADQLLGKQLEIGARYELTDARLNSNYARSTTGEQNLNSLLHLAGLHATWNHPSGLFSSLEADWYHQHDSGFSSTEVGDDFWQINAYAGYRFWHRRAEFTVGLLNLTDQGYHLEPLNLYNELPHGRTFLARLLISF